MDTSVLTERRIALVSLVAIATVAIGATLAWLRPLMIPFVFAIFLSFALAPVVDLLVDRAKMPRIMAVIACILLGFGVVSIIGGLISSSVQQLAENKSAYEGRLQELFVNGATYARKLGLEVDPATVRTAFGGLPIGDWMSGLTQGLVSTLSSGFLGLVFLIYFLDGRSMGTATTRVRGTIEMRIRRYLLAKTAISAATGLGVALMLKIIGVDLAFMFGVLAFVLNFIPNVGSIIATMLPLPVALLTPDLSTTAVILAVALPGTLQMVVGNVIEPKVLGDSLELHPVTILLSLILWGMLWGVAGMLLAAPITAVFKILFEEIPLLRPVARLMAGQIGRGANADEVADVPG